MNRTHKTRFLALALFGLVCLSYTSYGQSANNALARQNTGKSIKISENLRLQKEYTADITALGFATAEQAKRFFGRITDNRVSYRVNVSTNQVTMHLHLDRAPATWTAADWNNYISNKINSL